MLQITILAAGAGSGKTYTLTGKMVDLLQQGVRPGGIIATTFTQKAAAELQDRVRVRLLEKGMNEAANELGSALIGTVHSIGARLLQRFAYEAGVSPLVEIIAENDAQRIFNESLAQVLNESRIETMNKLADQLGLTKKSLGEPYDWRRVIREMTDVARANNFSRPVLLHSKQKSWESFQKLLPPLQNTDPVVWQNRLFSLIDQTAEALDANEADQTKLTRDAVAQLRLLQNQIKWRDTMYWHEWMKIAKTNVGAKSRDLFQPLHDFVRTHDEHRQFQADIKGFIDMVFDIAIDALAEFEQYKKKRGLIDYTDMETLVSRLLRIPGVQTMLRHEIDLLLVDEFQDTSPIQLDIFLQLSRLAKHSIWVGDPKQSIYGFRGAEPALMQAVINASGGIREENILKTSWRSRPDLVHAVNAVFTRAFHQTPPEQVALKPAPLFQENAGGGLVHWHFRSELDERKVPGAPWMENCIAAQIAVLLERGIPVWNKQRTATRPVQAGDIAVLCRNNKDCRDMADALHRNGLKASIARAGLLETPEVKLTLACLKYLVTPSDALSAAEITLLSGHNTLEEIVESRLEWLQEMEAGQGTGFWLADHVFIKRLYALRPRIADLSASEILNMLLDELDLRRIALSFGNREQRLDNIDKMRGYALEYESACTRLHTAASLGGFLLWIGRLAEQEKDFQGSGESMDAVKVLTYHRSKGLEYPVTICSDLDQPLKEQVWGINLVSETDSPDLENILGNRWLRFWVNPYADQLRGSRLEENLLQSPEWAHATRQALAEEARLLYVGLTRARDYLVFPTTVKPTKWLNRVFNRGDESIPTLDPDSNETPFYWNNQVLYCETECSYHPAQFGEVLQERQLIDYHLPHAGPHPAVRPALFINPASEIPKGFREDVPEPQPFAAWLAFKGDYKPSIGHALQALILADRSGMPDEKRLLIARKQIEIHRLGEALSPDQLALQSAACHTWLERQFRPHRMLTKFPVEWRIGGRLLSMEADLYWENSQEAGVVLFAGFAEGMKKWKTIAQSQALPAGWWRLALQHIKPALQAKIVLIYPVEGQAVML